jgi:hypothetical protein
MNSVEDCGRALAPNFGLLLTCGLVAPTAPLGSHAAEASVRRIGVGPMREASFATAAHQVGSASES